MEESRSCAFSFILLILVGTSKEVGLQPHQLKTTEEVLPICFSDDKTKFQRQQYMQSDNPNDPSGMLQPEKYTELESWRGQILSLPQESKEPQYHCKPSQTAHLISSEEDSRLLVATKVSRQPQCLAYERLKGIVQA